MSVRFTLKGAVRGSVPVVAVVLAASWLTACGGERKSAPGQKAATAAATPSKPAFDYCTLLTTAEVEAAVGWKVTSAKNNAGADYGDCTYVGRTDPMILPPEKVEAGVTSCVTNFPCYQDLPDFRSSAEMVQYRLQRYKDYKGAFEGMKANVVALDGFGVPAIDHELATLRSVEMQIGHKRVAYVTTWGAAGPTHDLARKVLARVPR